MMTPVTQSNQTLGASTSGAAVAATSFTADDVRRALQTVIDPELGIDIVRLGLIYNVTVTPESQRQPGITGRVGTGPHVHILMTLTTPGCPLIATFDVMVRSSLAGLPNLDTEEGVEIELTFDPPWVPDMMEPEARAELGFD